MDHKVGVIPFNISGEPIAKLSMNTNQNHKCLRIFYALKF